MGTLTGLGLLTDSLHLSDKNPSAAEVIMVLDLLEQMSKSSDVIIYYALTMWLLWLPR